MLSWSFKKHSKSSVSKWISVPKSSRSWEELHLSRWLLRFNYIFFWIRYTFPPFVELGGDDVSIWLSESLNFSLECTPICLIPQEGRSERHFLKKDRTTLWQKFTQRQTQKHPVCPRGGFLRVDSEPGELWISQKFLAACGPATRVPQHTERKARRPSEESLWSSSQGTSPCWINFKQMKQGRDFPLSCWQVLDSARNWSRY